MGAFLECGCDDIFTTKVMRAVLDFKWDLFGGSKHRWRVLHYFLYIVAVTVTMWDMHKSTSSGKWEDMDFGDSDNVETLIFVDIFFLLTTLMMIKTDLVGIWYVLLQLYHSTLGNILEHQHQPTQVLPGTRILLLSEHRTLEHGMHSNHGVESVCVSGETNSRCFRDR